MEKSVENPIIKLGSFLEIFSFYDYSHKAVSVTRRLSKTHCAVFRKWENALNEHCKKIVIKVCDRNEDCLTEFCHDRSIKFFNLDLELRRRTVVKKFIDLLLHFKKLRQEDIEKFEKLCEDNPSLKSSKQSYVSNNYLSIYRINTVPFKQMPETIDILKDLCPNVFQSPVNYFPNKVAIKASECADRSDEKLNDEFIPAELSNVMRYNPELDVLDLELQDADLTQFMANEKLTGSRISITAENDFCLKSAESFVSNPAFHENLTHIHLFMPKPSNNLTSTLLSTPQKFQKLERIVSKLDFEQLPDLLSHLTSKSLRTICEEFKSLTFLSSNQTLSLPYDYNDKNYSNSYYFGMNLNQQFALKTSESNLYEILVKGQYVVKIDSKYYQVTSNYPVRLASTGYIDKDKGHFCFKADQLIEFNGDSEISLLKDFQPSFEEAKESALFIFSVKNVVSMSMHVHQTDFSTEGDMFAIISNTLRENNVAAKCNLRFSSEITSSSNTQIAYLHSLVAENAKPQLFDSFSKLISLSLEHVDLDIKEVEPSLLVEKLSPCKNLRYLKLYPDLKTSGHEGFFKVEDDNFDSNFIQMLADLENLEEADIEITAFCNKKNCEDYGNALSTVLANHKRLIRVKYHSMELIKKAGGRTVPCEVPRWYQYVSLMM